MTEENVQESIEEVKEEIQSQTEDSNDKEKNFANLRAKIKEKDYIIAERERELEELRKFRQEKSAQAVPEEEYGDDDYTPRKTVRKDAEAIAEKKIREYEERNWKKFVKTDYPDFDDVATIENMEKLEEEMPEIVGLIQRAGTKYDMAIATYKAIKRMNRLSSPEKEIEQNRKQIEKNKDKPLSTAAVDKRPIAQVARYTDNDYQELWKEMHMYASRA